MYGVRKELRHIYFPYEYIKDTLYIKNTILSLLYYSAMFYMNQVTMYTSVKFWSLYSISVVYLID